MYGVGEHEGTSFYVMQFIRGQGLNDVLTEVIRLREAGGSFATTASPSSGREDDPSVTDVAHGLLAGQLTVESTGGAVAGEAADPDSRSGSDETQRSAGGVLSSHYWKSVAGVGVQIAEALQYAHAQGIYHRDIKPANLLLDAYGTVWVADFGLAKVATDDDLTRDGDVVGTLRYMAPEQFDSHCDARSDIYSLGLTLYELLTLQPAFDEPLRSAGHRADREPLRPRRINPQIPRDLETIVLKAAAPTPDHRYQTAGQLADDLRRFLADRPIQARSVSVLEHAWRWCRRNPVIASLTAAVALLLAVTVGVSVSLAIRFQAEKQLALDNTRLAEENSVRALEVASAGARSVRSGHDPGGRRNSLDSIARAVELLPNVALPAEQKLTIRRELRDEAIAAMTTVGAQRHEDWSYNAAPLGLIRAGFDSEMQHYARQEESGRVVVRKLADNSEVRQLGAFDVEAELRVYVKFSPDDRLLAARGPVDGVLYVRVWNIADGELLLEFKAAGRTYHTSLDFGPDSKTLAAGVSGKRVAIFEVASGRMIREIPTRRLPYFVRFDPSGRRLAIGGGPGDGRPGEVLIINEDSPTPALRLAHPNFVCDAAWSADGRWLATPCYDYHVRVWDTSTGQVHTVCDGHRGKLRHVAFHPRRDLLMSTAWDSTTRLWNLHTGQELLRSTDRGVSFSRDGRWLGSEQPASVGVRRWQIATADACRTLYGHNPDAYVVFLAFSPNGEVLASGSAKDGVRLWDVARGSELMQLVTEYTAGVGFVGDQWQFLTSTRSGLRSWNIEVQQTDLTKTLLIEPPKILAAENPRRLALSGQAFLVASTNSKVTLHRDGTLTELGPLRGPSSGNTRFVALSPDGRWAATSGKRAPGITIWDLETATVARELPTGAAQIAFSPDGKQLIASVFQQYIFLETESWRELRRLTHDGPGYGCVAFSPDMKLMATTASHRAILWDAVTGEELATLAAPNPELLSTAHPEGAAGLCFSPDGSLLAVGAQGGKIRLWDVHTIRRGLAEIGLDWTNAPLPAASSGETVKLAAELLAD